MIINFDTSDECDVFTSTLQSSPCLGPAPLLVISDQIMRILFLQKAATTNTTVHHSSNNNNNNNNNNYYYYSNTKNYNNDNKRARISRI